VGRKGKKKTSSNPTGYFRKGEQIVFAENKLGRKVEEGSLLEKEKDAGPGNKKNVSNGFDGMAWTFCRKRGRENVIRSTRSGEIKEGSKREKTGEAG